MKRYKDNKTAEKSFSLKSINDAITFGAVIFVSSSALALGVISSFFISLSNAQEKGLKYGIDDSVILLSLVAGCVLGGTISLMLWADFSFGERVFSELWDTLKEGWSEVIASLFLTVVGLGVGFLSVIVVLVMATGHESTVTKSRAQILEDKGYSQVMILDEFDGIISDPKTSKNIDTTDMKKGDNLIAKDGDKSYRFTVKQKDNKLTFHKGQEVKVAEQVN